MLLSFIRNSLRNLPAAPSNCLDHSEVYRYSHLTYTLSGANPEDYPRKGCGTPERAKSSVPKVRRSAPKVLNSASSSPSPIFGR